MGEGGVNEIDEEGRRKESDVSVVGIVRGEEVGSAREGVRASKEFSGDMDHLQVEIGEVNKPARLGLAEIGKIFVVSEDLHREGGTMEVVTPRLQGVNNSEKFAIIDIIIPFGGGEGLRQVGAWVPVAVGIGLEEDGTRRMFGGICGDGEGGREVGEKKDGFGEEKAFEGVKGGLARRGPVPGEVLLGKVEEGASDIGVVGDKPMVEVGESKERTNISHLGWCRPVCDTVEFDGVHGQLAGFHDHSKVFHLVGGELAFLEFQVKVKLGHMLQNTFRAFLVEGGVGGINEEVVHIDNEPSFGDHIAEEVVHESLECCGGVGEPEEHHGRLEEPLMGDEGGFPLVSIFDPYVVISPADVELSENFSIPQFIYEVGDERKGIGVADGVFVDIAVVLAGAESSILLFDEEERGCLGGIGRADLSRGEVFI